MARHDINKKTSLVENVKKYIQARPAIIPNDKYEAYALELKKTRNQLNLHKITNYILAVVCIVTLTIIFTR